jgi:PAS domain S-box-containing protein
VSAPRPRSLAARILVPVGVLAVLSALATTLVVERIVGKVRGDYDRFTLDAAASHVTATLDNAAAELTAARLTGNPLVAEVKRTAVAGAIVGYWQRAGLDGVIVGSDGRIVATTLSEGDAAAVRAARRPGLFAVGASGGQLRCLAEPFPVWDWSVVTVGRRAPLASLRPELALLVPLLTIVAIALTASVLALLWRNLRNPVARMAADVDADREVRSTGLAELDRIGAAINSAMARLRVRTDEVSAELDRRREAERALRDREARIRLLLESTAEGILGMNREGVCTFCNPAALRLLGRTTEQELLGKNVHEVVHAPHADGSPYPDERCPVRETARSGVSARVADEVFWRRDGTSFPVEYWSYPMHEDGVLRGAVLGFIDISERAALEGQLRQAQKMEAVGRLAGGIAHDFNNVLMAIQGHAEVAREVVGDAALVQEDLAQILEAADKAAALTRRLLAFSRKQPVSLVPVDLNELVLGMGKVLSRLLGDDVEVSYELARGELVVMADRAQLEQVLLNLWTNARDAMPDGGRLVIGTAGLDADPVASAALGLQAAGRYVAVTVSDTGVGMDETTRLRIFEPFFTTKERGKGTGLGLSIVYGIVRQHHGHIEVGSSPGKGTTVRIHLPRVEHAAAATAAPPALEARGGSETVLLAEDNEQVRALTRSVLERAGYRVIVAHDGQEAVALHDRHEHEIALCLFDVVMPRLGGREALEVIRAHRPGVRALLMSGYVPEEEEDRHGVSNVPLLPKPIAPGDLLRQVRDALDA